MKKLISLFCMLLVVLLVSCSSESTEGGKNEVNFVYLSKPGITLYEGQSYKVESRISPLDAVNPALSWHSSESDVCSVENGIITALKKGISVVSAKSSNGKTASLKVEVRSINDIKAINLSDFRVSLLPGETHTLIPSIFPSTSSEGIPVIWESMDTEVAAVDENGTVTAIGEGKCVIKATVSDVVSAACQIIVELEAEEPPADTPDTPDNPNLPEKEEPLDPSLDATLVSLVDLVVRDLPMEISYTDNKGEILTTSLISSYEIERELWEGGVVVTVKLNGKKIYDRDGENGKNIVGVKMTLYMENDEYCTDRIDGLEDVGVGEEFVMELFVFNAEIKPYQREFYIILENA